MASNRWSVRRVSVFGCCVLFAAMASAAPPVAQDRETKVRNDRIQAEAEGRWIYNDLPQAFAAAKESGKPLLVVFRCIPCEACAQLDQQVAERDPRVMALMDQFVCARVVHANGMDLSLFQFDYDQSFAAFFLNADRTIYGRYGTRSHRTESAQDVSVEGFAAALEQVLAWHKAYPQNAELFAKKKGPPPVVPAPEKFPTLAGKFTSKIDYEGQVVKSCIHCHQVGEAERRYYRDRKETIPTEVLFPYPLPSVVGLTMDPQSRATVKSVLEGSPAAAAGFVTGDEITTLDQQGIASTADLQWVLHRTGSTARLVAEVRTADGKMAERTIKLGEGWRQRGDISWRASSWELRRMTSGGLVLEDAAAADREAAGIDGDSLALRVKHVGQYGDHALAKQKGFKVGDIIIAIDGDQARIRETDFIARVLTQKTPGETLSFDVRRGEQTLKIVLPVR